MRELLRGYASATFDPARAGANLDAVVAELSGFDRAVVASNELRRALGDGALAVDIRKDIVADLLAQKASSETTQLLSYAISYERAGDLSSSFAALLHLAELTNASSEDELLALDTEVAHAPMRERVRGYAERVLQELTSIDEVDEVEDELFRFARVLDANPSLRRVLSDTSAPYTMRAGIVSDLIERSVQRATLRIVKYVLRAGRVRDLVGIFDRLVELVAAERGRRVAEVRSAFDLDEPERTRLASALGRLVERTVEVRVIHDPSVVAGMLIAVGDLVIDGTVRTRFERLRDSLAQAS